MVYLRVMVSEEILNEPVDWNPESVAKEVDEEHNLAKIWPRAHWYPKSFLGAENPPTTRLLMSSSIAVDMSHEELGTGLHPPLLFELISSSLTELMVLVFLARVFLDTITVTVDNGI